MQYIDQYEIIEKITGGHSPAKLYKVKKDGHIYCMKVFVGKLNKEDIKISQEICSIYKYIGINSLELIDYGVISDNKFYYIYNYINAHNFKKYSDENLTEEEVYKFGRIIGKKLKLLKNYCPKQESNLTTVDIVNITALINKKYIALKEDKTKMELIEKYFDIKDIDKKMEEFNKITETFLYIDKKIIHGDIKRSNFMIDDNYNWYLIDIESTKYSYDVLNYRYQITWWLFKGNRKEKSFNKGVLDELYDDIRPKHFNEQIRYVIMMNFIEHINTNNDMDKLEQYLIKSKWLFSNVYNKTNII